MTSAEIRIGGPADVPRLAEVSRAAFALFGQAGLDLPPDDPEAELSGAGRLLVAEFPGPEGGPLAVGFAQLVELDGHAHLAEISVHPDYGRRGVGSALLEAACADAAGRGLAAMTLTTFRDVPFNGPWYARMGFTELPREQWGAELAAQWRAEEGLLVAPRVVLCRELF
ncbi:ribosomal protein S18 acetylase RimI-like enzyme [Lipingzhangella halophila]|uniref:Ribosomal protein S18 acetylase RimI-like enzyme n=1 Tax=Lipingzhangella halophila TaxID=1783352 RepID=A0A7W7W5K7_9ACTN|nr:GNAT family N-acetyltransferase [Lipingzhangella halophila]MBB4935337.1 ribosomal protein S18 acetylase RimI-like enzyme [Lipingzhangella halophila]